MACFDNIISLRGGCTEVTPTSGYYLDNIDLYRVEIEKFIQDPYNDVDSFVNDKIAFAVNDVSNTMYMHFQDKYINRSIIKGERIGYVQSNMQLQTGSSNLRGIVIEFCNESSFVDLYISEISLFIDTSGAKNILVYDLLQNKLLDTLPITTVANEQVSIFPHKTYHSDRKKLELFIGYDSTGSNSYLTYLAQNGCVSCGDANGYSTQWLTANGAEYTAGENKILSNYAAVGHSSGISINYSINCNHKEWLCANAGVIGLPILYRTAADIMQYAMNTSERFNSKINIDFKEIENKFYFYDKKYNETLQFALGRILPPNDRLCFMCNDRVRVSYTV